MKITQDQSADVSVLSLKGDLTAEFCDLFRSTAMGRIENDARDFVLNLKQTDFIDSQGLETLLWLQDVCDEQLGQVRLAAPSDNIRTILTITRLASRFEVHDDVDKAMKSL